MLVKGLNSDGELLRDVYVVHDPVDLDCSGDPSMTRQEFKDECDINVLLATYERTGVVNHFSRGEPHYFDATEVPDLHRALSMMDSAQAAFMTLPAVVRREFDNDPIKFVEFAGDPANLPKMREWGLAPHPEVLSPQAADASPAGGSASGSS